MFILPSKQHRENQQYNQIIINMESISQDTENRKTNEQIQVEKYRVKI